MGADLLALELKSPVAILVTLPKELDAFAHGTSMAQPQPEWKSDLRHTMQKPPPLRQGLQAVLRVLLDL